LGLPTALPLELDDSAFRPLNQMFERYENLFRQYEATIREAERFSAPEAAATVRRELRRIFTTSGLVQGTRFRADIETRWAAWEKLSADDLKKRMDGLKEELAKLLDKKANLEAKGQALS